MRRRAVTLIELLVVITIIAILVTIVSTVVTMLLERQRRVTTTQTMEQLQTAIDLYLQRHPLLGDADGSGVSAFAKDPAGYLLAEDHQFLAKHLLVDSSGTGDGPFRPVDHPDQATHFRDGYGLPFLFQIDNQLMTGSTTRYHTSAVLIRSTAGSARIEDDIVRLLDVGLGSWTPVALTAVAPDGTWEYRED